MPPKTQDADSGMADKPIADSNDDITQVSKRHDVMNYVLCQDATLCKRDFATLTLSPVMVKYFCLLRNNVTAKSIIQQALYYLRNFSTMTDEEVRQDLQCRGDASTAFAKCSPKQRAIAEILWLWKFDLQAWEEDRSRDSEYDQYYDQLITDMNASPNKDQQRPAYTLDSISSDVRKGPDKLPPGLTDEECKKHGEIPTLEVCNRLWVWYWHAKQHCISGARITTGAFLKDNNGDKYNCRPPKWWDDEGEVNDKPHPLAFAEAQGLFEKEEEELHDFKAIRCTVKIRAKKVFKEAAVALEDDDLEVPMMPPDSIEIENPCQYRDLAEWRDIIRTKFNIEPWKANLVDIRVCLTMGDGKETEKVVWSDSEWMSYDQLFECLQIENLEEAAFSVRFRIDGSTTFECSRLAAHLRKHLHPDPQDGDVALESEPEDASEDELARILALLARGEVQEPNDPEEDMSLGPESSTILADEDDYEEEREEEDPTPPTYVVPSVEDVEEDDATEHPKPSARMEQTAETRAQSSTPTKNSRPPSPKADFAARVEDKDVADWIESIREGDREAGRQGQERGREVFHELNNKMRALAIQSAPPRKELSSLPKLPPQRGNRGKYSGPRLQDDGVKGMKKALKASQVRGQKAKKVMDDMLRHQRTRRIRNSRHNGSNYNSRSRPNLHSPTEPSAGLEGDQFGRSHEQFIKEEYDGYDVINDKRAKIEWMRYAINMSVGQSQAPQKKWGTSFAVQDVAHAMDANMRQNALNRNADSNEDPKKGDESKADKVSDVDVEAALFGATGHPGPALDLCLKLLGMEKTVKHGNMWKYRSKKYMDDCKVDLLPTQITGMVHMLWRTLGTFPLSKEQQKERPYFENIVKMLNYDSPLTHGGILGDSPGMGKTYTTLAFFNWYAQHAEHVDEDGNPDHRPSVLVVPDGVVFHQWVTAAARMFPKINLIACKPGDPWPQMNETHSPFEYLSSEQTRDPWSKKSGFPTGLQYVFDNTDPRASRALFVAPYKTWLKRVVDLSDAPLLLQDVRPLRDNCMTVKLNADEKEKLGREEIVRMFTCPKWQNVMVGMAMCDEGHTIRNPTTHMHWSVRGLHAKKNWLLTATPVIQYAPELADLSRVLWPSILQDLKRHPRWKDIGPNFDNICETMHRSQPWKAINSLIAKENIPPNDSLQLMCLEPNVLRCLLESKDLKAIAANFKKFDDFLTLRRSPESSLPNLIGPDLPLKSIMVEHKTVTSGLQFRQGAEEIEHLYWHRRASKKYEELCQLQRNKSKSARHKVPPVSPALRQMSIAAASNLLSRFERQIVEFTKGNTNVESIKNWRDSGLDADMLLYIANDGDTIRKGKKSERPSRAERLSKLTEGSPKLREILIHIRDYVLPKEGEKGPLRFRKLLITEELPLVAWFWELALNFLHVHTQVLHSELEEHEREFVVDQFNNPPADGDLSHLTVLVLLYTINASGVNLDWDCNRCIVATAASSAPLEIQAWSRLIRVSQQKEVEIFRLCVDNSHDEWREASQANKALIDAATKAFSGQTKKTLAKLLSTDGIEEIEDVKRTALGKAIQGIFDDKLFGDDFAEARAELYQKVLENDIKEKLSEEDAAELKPMAKTTADKPQTPEPEFLPPNTANPKAATPSRAGNYRAPEQESLPTNKPQTPEPEFLPPNTANPQAATPSRAGDDRATEQESLLTDTGTAPQTSTRAVAEANSASRKLLEEEMKAHEEAAAARIIATAEDAVLEEVEDPNAGDEWLGDGGDVDDEEMIKTETLREQHPATECERREETRQLHPKHQNELSSKSSIGDKWKSHLGQMSSNERKTLDQDIVYTLYICQIEEPKRKYKAEEIENLDSITIERALRLLHRHRSGKERTKSRVAPHLDYSKLEHEKGMAVMAKIKHETCRADIEATAEAFGFAIKSQKERSAEALKEAQTLKEIKEDMARSSGQRKAPKSKTTNSKYKSKATVEDEDDDMDLDNIDLSSPTLPGKKYKSKATVEDEDSDLDIDHILDSPTLPGKKYKPQRDGDLFADGGTGGADDGDEVLGSDSPQKPTLRTSTPWFPHTSPAFGSPSRASSQLAEPSTGTDGKRSLGGYGPPELDQAEIIDNFEQDMKKKTTGEQEPGMNAEDMAGSEDEFNLSEFE
ncbi:hypothetical protein M409DRAFT_23735 [Zasmidium cellare ATCC 36951]|uniref:SNF2 N-terminal domain-containing protein n=1 Tax=Zasmidium cellare ATCC 36951 TaxID=1080233 RepID=A0A6A6CFJ6_ZASCE|nr:uncharacterized protein M409DRAFT_23735 [Zasmidium cellare ATCC 36951]KAF2166007.1 hypothetical protein M409DRAFT_23735 [Zasmidium cellare ATCC 36951]